MKNFLHLIMAAFAVCTLLPVSCIKDEAPNSECDITKAYVHVADADEMFFSLSDTIINVVSTDSVISFNVRRNADISSLAPVFTLTEGATISPANGSTHDFSQGPVVYTVTSQNKAWRRSYKVAFNHVTVTVSDTSRFDFEHYHLDATGHYYMWQRELSDGSLSNEWATANAGFQLSMGTALSDEYPTVPVANGYDGSAVKLTTMSTGPFGAMVNKRMAAGNLYLGTFVLDSALSNPLKSTFFGVPFDGRPVSFSGYYKYTPGKDFQDRTGKIHKELTDSAAVYAVFYRNHDAAGNAVTLYGDNIKTSPQIVAIADTKYLAPTDTWTPFEVNFDYSQTIDWQLLANRGYNLAVVFSASKYGDIFWGAIGSTLYIDKVSVISTKED